MKLTKKLTVEQKNQLKNMVFVGRLASPDELSLTFIESPITISEYGNKITFYIKCLSEIPGEIEEHFEYQNKIFTGNTNSYYNIRLLEQYDIFMEREHYVDLKPKVKNLLENRLIIFQLDPKDEFIYVDMKDIEPIQPEQQYYLLPGPKLKLSEDNKDLADKLVGNRRPIGLDYYPDILTPAPELIIYDDYLYRVDLECKSNPTTYFQKELSEVKYIQLSPEEKSQYLDVMYDDYLYFVSAKNYDYLWQKVENEGAVLNDEIETEVVIGNEEMRKNREDNKRIESAAGRCLSIRASFSGEAEIYDPERFPYLPYGRNFAQFSSERKNKFHYDFRRNVRHRKNTAGKSIRKGIRASERELSFYPDYSLLSGACRYFRLFKPANRLIP